eukprot:TRINITY_DN11951_c0_g1_i1.p1 TRINITY_DN11951_c0_g1~~TRINITY_DN11951_c0_g1_i1.p1  ORF type:complete len:270 (+),score=64.30 TRINITY_DN11951_c0_g1_i1:1495-2304(+)
MEEGQRRMTELLQEQNRQLQSVRMMADQQRFFDMQLLQLQQSHNMQLQPPPVQPTVIAATQLPVAALNLARPPPPPPQVTFVATQTTPAVSRQMQRTHSQASEWGGVVTSLPSSSEILEAARPGSRPGTALYGSSIFVMPETTPRLPPRPRTDSDASALFDAASAEAENDNKEREGLMKKLEKYKDDAELRELLQQFLRKGATSFASSRRDSFAASPLSTTRSSVSTHTNVTSMVLSPSTSAAVSRPPSQPAMDSLRSGPAMDSLKSQQ